MRLSERASIRKRAGLTQLRLAKSAGLAASRLSLWESGEIELVPEQVLRIARVLYEHLSERPVFKSVTELAQALEHANGR